MIKGKISVLRNSSGNVSFPVTSSRAVYMDDGVTTAEDKLNKFEKIVDAIPPKSELKGEKGDKGDKGDTPSITHLETSINNKISDVETRFNRLTSQQQQDAEVIDARDGETSLKARLDRDIEKANISNVVNILQEKVSLLEDKFIQGLKQVLAGDMYSLAELLYPEDFVSEEEPVDVPTLLI